MRLHESKYPDLSLYSYIKKSNNQYNVKKKDYTKIIVELRYPVEYGGTGQSH